MFENLKKELAECVRMMENIKLIDYNGHVSLLIESEKVLLINSFGANRKIVSQEDIVVIDMEGKKIEGSLDPPLETPLHTQVYKQRDDVKSVAHIHAKYTIMYGVVDSKFKPVYISGSVLNQVGFYNSPRLITTKAQGDDVALALGSGNMVMLRGHGAIITGIDLADVFVKSVYLEDNCEKALFSSIIGTPIYLSEEELTYGLKVINNKKIQQKVWDYYKQQK